MKLLNTNSNVYKRIDRGIFYTDNEGTFKDYCAYTLHTDFSATFEAPQHFPLVVQIHGLKQLVSTTLMTYLSLTSSNM